MYIFLGKKPFITTVRSGNELPPLQPLQEHNSNLKCTKCHVGYYQRKEIDSQTKVHEKEMEKLENTNKDLMDHIKFLHKKVCLF